MFSSFDALGMDAIGASGTPVAGDSSPPSPPGAITLSQISTDGAHVGWGASIDDVGVVAYEISVDTGTPLWQNVGLVLSKDIVGKQPNTSYAVRVRALDAANNRSGATTATLTTQSQNGNGVVTINAATVPVEQTVIFGTVTKTVTFTAVQNRVDF
jgi:hypothetical protein